MMGMNHCSISASNLNAIVWSDIEARLAIYRRYGAEEVGFRHLHPGFDTGKYRWGTLGPQNKTNQISSTE